MRIFDTMSRALDNRGELAGLDAYHARALEMIRSNQTREAFDLTKEPASVRALYGSTPEMRSSSSGPVAGRGRGAHRDLVRRLGE